MGRPNKAEVEFRANVSQFNSELKKVSSQLGGLTTALKLNASEMRRSSDSISDLENKQKLLKDKISLSKEQQALLNNKISEATQLFGPNSDMVARLTNELNNAKPQKIS